MSSVPNLTPGGEGMHWHPVESVVASVKMGLFMGALEYRSSLNSNPLLIEWLPTASSIV